MHAQSLDRVISLLHLRNMSSRVSTNVYNPKNFASILHRYVFQICVVHLADYKGPASA